MAYANYASVVLRASGTATVGTEEQDAAVTLPETVTDIWVVVTKTAEANADNLLTVRLQGKSGSDWFDISRDTMQTKQALVTAADVANDVSRTPNIVDASSGGPGSTWTAYYKALPTNIVRTVSVSSGTGVVNTFGATASFRYNGF